MRPADKNSSTIASQSSQILGLDMHPQRLVLVEKVFFFFPSGDERERKTFSCAIERFSCRHFREYLK
jgi:hypothetical protein